VTDWRVGAFGTFQLQYTADLTQSVWNPLGSPVQAERPNLRFRDTSPTDTQRFYRLQRVVP